MTMIVKVELPKQEKAVKLCELGSEPLYETDAGIELVGIPKSWLYKLYPMFVR